MDFITHIPRGIAAGDVMFGVLADNTLGRYDPLFTQIHSNLFMHTLILVIIPIIGAGTISSREEPLHFVLVQIAGADISVQILVKIIVYTALAIGHNQLFGKFFILHLIRLPFISVVYHKKFIITR